MKITEPKCKNIVKSLTLDELRMVMKWMNQIDYYPPSNHMDKTTDFSIVNKYTLLKKLFDSENHNWHPLEVYVMEYKYELIYKELTNEIVERFINSNSI